MPEEREGAERPDETIHDPPAIGPYRLIRELGRGGQGIVWEAHDRRLGRRVALKVQLAWASLPAEALARFHREARVAARIDHPGICQVYDAGCENGVPYIAMQLLEGETLSARLASAVSATRSEETSGTRDESIAEPIDLSWVLGIIESVARALHAAHSSGIVHRDLKPGNIMITAQDRPVILDFGMAWAEAADLPALTGTGDLFGTPAYMSPEQIRGAPGGIDAGTDIWSLGVCLYEAVTGRRPFEAPTREALYREILLHEPPAPRAVRPGLSRDLLAVLSRAMEKDRRRRYATALEFAEDLSRAREGRPVAARSVGPAGRTWRWARRRPAAAALIAVLAIAIPSLTGLGTFAVGSREDLARQRERERLDGVERRLGEGFLAAYEKDQEIALTRFREVLDLDPGSWEARAGMALVFADRDEAARVLEVFEIPVPSPPEPAGIRLMRTRALRALGRITESDREAQALTPPVEPMDHFLAALNACHAAGDDSETGRWQEIAEQALAAVESAPVARRIYHYTSASLASRQSEPGLQRRLAASLTAIWPEDAEAWQLSARLRRGWDPDRAIADARKACELSPDGLKPRLTLAEILAGSGRHEEAAAICAVAGRSAPDDARIPLLLSRIHRKAGRLEEAINAGRRAVVLDPDGAGPRAVLVEALIDARQTTDAVEQARQLSKESPRRLMSHYLLAKAETLAGDVEAAIASFRRAAEINPAHVPTRTGLGVLLYERGDAEGARTEFQAAADSDPDSAVAWVNLGNALHRLGRDSDAAEAWSRAVRIAPDHAAAWDRLGQVRQRARRFEDAAEAFRKAASLRPDHAEYQCNLGHALRELGRYAEALESLRKGHEMGSAKAEWRYPTLAWIDNCEKLAVLDSGLDEALLVASASTEAPDLERLVQICRARRRIRDEVRILRLLLAPDRRAPGRPHAWRLRGAEAAVLGASAPAGAEGNLPVEAASRFRHEALVWAEEECGELEAAAGSGGEAVTRIARMAGAWLDSQDLAPVREGPAFDGLPLTEQVAWGRTWERLRRLHAASP